MKNMLASAVLMIRPCCFGYNTETEASNVFQKQTGLLQSEIQKRALIEFDDFACLLKDHKISVEIFDDTPIPSTPDSIFPNNWFSVHENGLLIIYPMLAGNRRPEKRMDIIDTLKKKCGIKKMIDLSHFEEMNRFLEGTGSLVFDHQHKKGYGCLSSRTDKGLAEEVCRVLGYEAIIFLAEDSEGKEIYHTNVIMSIGKGFAIICLASIKNISERNSVAASLIESQLEIIEISFEQMKSFCGNVLELQNREGEKVLVMSENARNAFHEDQGKRLRKYAKIIFSPLETIESVGGGSARCMMAELG